MSGPAEIWRLAADKWSEVIAQVGDDDWGKQTPCDEWNVRELVDHAMHWQAMGGGIFGAGTAPGNDWDTVKPSLSAALDDPSNLEGTVEQFGGMPKHQVLGLVIADLLVHSWDLARSIGADDTLPAAAVEATMMGLGNAPDAMLRGDNMFGPAVEIVDDASAQDKLIAFVGRRP